MPPTEPTNMRDDSTADTQNRAHGTGTTSIDRDQVEEILGTNFSPSQRSEPIISEEGVDSKIPDILRPNEFREVPAVCSGTFIISHETVFKFLDTNTMFVGIHFPDIVVQLCQTVRYKCIIGIGIFKCKNN